MSSQSGFTEADWENIALSQLNEQGWSPLAGSQIAPGTEERDSWDELLIRPRLLSALRRLNPDVPGQYLQQALAEIVAPSSQDAITENHRIHQMMTDGYRMTYLDADGQEHTPTIRIIGAEESDNEYLAVNQVTIVKGDFKRRFDIVLYCNGMPVSIMELKQAGATHVDISAAHSQLQTYLREFPLAFRFSVFTFISDGLNAQYGTPFTPLNHFSPWNVDDEGAPISVGHMVDGQAVLPIDTAISGLYNPTRFLKLLFSFIAFDSGADGYSKRIAKPHQYFAVSKAVGSTIGAVRSNGKAGVVWHTQGSGKSMEMELYTAAVMRHPVLKNPTIIVITDRTELDGQLYSSFARSDLLPDSPQQVATRADLRAELSGRGTGGIYFTTLQKFALSKEEKESGAEHPTLSDRRNIIVIVDEAHRSHYDDLDGYARHLHDALPNATFIAFTGTPISFEDRNTRDVFGDYIDIYDLSRAVADGATVQVFFEPRLIKVELAEGMSEKKIDEAAAAASEGLDDFQRVKLEQSAAVINAVYGAPDRLTELAKDLVHHWENRRAAVAPSIADINGGPTYGKAMIVGATREICANLYTAITALRPDWHADEIDKGKIKVVYSGDATDAPPVSDHVRKNSANNAIKARLKDPSDELELVIVKDMMLTGFDAPPLHTLYLDRPLKGALLMQTLARVNRTFRGKDNGLLVAYAPLAENLAKALAEYTQTDQQNRPVGKNIDEAVALAEELVRKIRVYLEGYDWRAVLNDPHPRAFINAATGATNYLRNSEMVQHSDDDEPSLAERFTRDVNGLSRAWGLCSGSGKLDHLRSEIQFYMEVQVWLGKFKAQESKDFNKPVPEDVERLLSNLIAASTDATGEVLDIYAAAGMPKPSLNDLTPDFVAKTLEARHPQLAIESLRSLVMEESKKATKSNEIRRRAFSERVLELMRKYTNQQLTSAEIIAELIELAKEVAEESNRGQKFDPPLNEDELAFYDAVALNESAVTEQGPDMLAEIARQLVDVMRSDTRTDWTVREDVRARLRGNVRRLLVLNGYPPDKQPAAIKEVISQMETMAMRTA